MKGIGPVAGIKRLVGIERLVGIAGPSLGDESHSSSATDDQLLPLYQLRNGFVAFESALLVRPRGSGAGSIEWWNGELDWRAAYTDLPPQAICFAEDLFGFQFVVDGSAFYSFDPETGELEHVGNSVNEWAEAILDDPDMRTGFSLGHEWQLVNGPLPPGHRLAPAVPFMLGGEYSVEALRAKPDAELASFRAAIYSQVKDLPDGATVSLRIE